jgi:subtilase family serine protease
MHPKRIWIILAAILFVSLQAFAQGNQARSLITQPVNETKLTVLKGDTHPLARPEFDRGAAPADLPMDRMMLVLKRSPEQESALEKLLAEQTDKTSPNYHKWLTPEQFGDQFGPSDSDIQAVISWLESHGFQIGHVAEARNIIEFSGNAAQVQQTFHTSIHKYTVNGEDHWANSSDPQIPEALTPVVVGVKSLHNFLSKPMYHSKGVFTKSKATGEVKPVNPLFTFQGACGLTGVTCYALGPYDFATIYNVLPLWNAGSPIDGTGQRIGVVGRTDVVLADMQNFRKFVGLPAKDPIITVNGTDPGTNKGDEGESDLDLQWAGGVAKGATIEFVTSASTNSEDGVDLSAQYILEHNQDAILTYSYGLCEAELTPTGYNFNSGLWQQAAALGITVSVATGDTGSSLCEDPTVPNQPGTTGLAVNGIAASPYNVAVGGTDFNDFSNQSTYWSSTNNSVTLQSALSYIPETAYNDTCTNSVFSQDGYSANAETNCNNAALADFTSPFGGGGGKSTLDLTKPVWQVGQGVPNDNVRDLPDVSLFAGDGTMVGSAYIVCQADAGGSCVETDQGAEFFLVGGTSASTQVFGAIMAMVDQKAGDPEGKGVGNANTVMYPLANTAPLAASCNSSSSPSSSCIFYDVTLGTIAMPCEKGSTTSCVVNNGADTIGILNASGVPAYNAGVGYDLATGLGTINAENFVNASAWSSTPDFTLTSSAPSLTISSQGGSGQLTFTVTSVNNYSGTFNLSPSLCTDLPAETTCSFSVSSVSVSPGTPTAQFTMTVQTMAPSILVPGIRTKTPRIGPALLALVLSCSLAMFLFWFGPHANRRRLSTALAFVAVGIMLSISACGSSSSSSCGVTCSGGGGTPIGTTTGNTLTLTDAAGTTTHKFVFTLTVN